MLLLQWLPLILEGICLARKSIRLPLKCCYPGICPLSLWLGTLLMVSYSSPASAQS